MEELKLKSAPEIPLIAGECTNRIEPEGLQEKKKIGAYIFLTLSSLIFVLAFTLSDLGYKLISNGTNQLPSTILGSVFGEEVNIDLSFSEYISKRVLGIGRIKPQSPSDPITDEPPKNDKTPVIADTISETQVTEPNDDDPSETSENEGEEKIKYPIVAMDLSQKKLGKYYIGNETGYTPNVKALLEGDFPIPASSKEEIGQPLVLIIHTHGTESYVTDDAEFYIDDGGDISRTEDKEKNVVHIGRIIKEVLISEGINTLHCEIMHDAESYSDSYTRAAETIREYLAKYPSIKYVFDVHRDAIMKSDGALVKAVCELEGKEVAQVMTVVGSNYKGASFPDWEGHLSLALKLKERLDEKYEAFSRPVYLRGAAYNQQYTPGSLLLEIGTSGNTLEEAERAAVLVAEELAGLITNRE